VLGLRNHAAADQALEAIAANKPLLLVGPPGCEQRAIADEIHRRSPYSDRAFVEAPLHFASRAEQDDVLTRAARGSIYIDATRLTDAADLDPLPNHFVAGAFGDCRPIVAALSEEIATELLDHFGRRLHTIMLATPASRPEDIPRLLDALIVQEHDRKVQAGEAPGELLPITALGEENLAGLRVHPWPGNFADLRRQVPRLHALLTNGLRLRATARALGLRSVASLSEALDRIGIHVKPSDGDDAPIDGSGDDDERPTPPGAPTR
jgi:DNA-binding NtrC family response regulator